MSVASAVLLLLVAGDVEDLATKLRDPEVAVRREAAAALAQQGAAAAPVEPQLVAALRDVDPSVGRTAALALERIRLRSGAPRAATVGADARDVAASVDSIWARLAQGGGDVDDRDLERLTEAYHDASEVYGRALLLQDDRAFEVAVRDLVGRLGTTARLRHARRVGQLPHATPDDNKLPAVVAWMAAPPEERFQRAEEVAHVGGHALAVLSDALAGDRAELHATAAFALFVADPARTEVIDWLQQMLFSEHDIVRAEAAHALGRIGLPAASAVPGLMLALESDDQKLRGEAAWALCQLGPAARNSARLLGMRLRDRDPGTVANAAAALHALGPGAACAAPELARCLKDEDSPVLSDVAASLGAIGTLSPAVVPALSGALDRAWASEKVDPLILALTSIGPPAAPAAPRLLDLVAVAPSDATERLAEDALVAIGEAAVPAICDGLKVLGSHGSGVRQKAALRVLARMGADAKDAIPRLCALVLDKGSYISADAARALGKIGYGDRKAASALTRALDRPYSDIQENAARALGEVGPVAKDATPKLAALLRDNDWKVRLAAAEGLAGIGPAAKEALPALEKLADEDPGAQIHAAALKAIKAIRQ